MNERIESKLPQKTLKAMVLATVATAALGFAKDNQAQAYSDDFVENFGNVTAKVDDDHKIDICHATDSVKNRYVPISVDKNAADGIAGNSGNRPDHFGKHRGPIASNEIIAQELKSNHIKWGDIIPPIQGVHEGYNWSSEGQAIWENGCEAPEVVVTPTPTPSEKPTPTPVLGPPASEGPKPEITPGGFPNTGGIQNENSRKSSTKGILIGGGLMLSAIALRESFNRAQNKKNRN